MGKLTIAGLGPGNIDAITGETLRAIEEADIVILRTESHPAADGLKAVGIPFVSCDSYYDAGDDFQQIYRSIADYVLSEANQDKDVCYCVPGHPRVAEDTVELLVQMHGEATALPSDTLLPELEILPALSFLDAAFVLLGVDPIKESMSILDAALLWDGDNKALLPLPNGSCLFAQVYNQHIAGELKLALLEAVSPETEVMIIHHAGIKGEDALVKCTLAELDHARDIAFDHLTSVYLPGASTRATHLADDDIINGADDPSSADGGHSHEICYPLDALVEVLRRLLGPGGCPWDQKQTHESLKPYLLEESGEALEAIDEGDMAHLQEELGDVLLQIVFHCALAEGRGDFDINDVIGGITEKMIRRHPHVFGDETANSPEEVMILWEKIKAEEKTKENRAF
ncbi:MAG: MazG family protein [Clostridiales bacterium]|nr:MazG family protein [Clostridiales bacterium]